MKYNVVIPEENKQSSNLQLGQNLFKTYWKYHIIDIIEEEVTDDEMYKIINDISEDECLWEYINNAILDILNNIRREE